MTTSKRIGVLTGGGDAPGLNAVLRAIVKSAVRRHGWSVVGIEDGFEGLLGDPRTRSLGLDDVRGLLPRGGSILGCTNRGHFKVSDKDGQVVKNEAAFAEAVANCNRLGLDALVIVGGDGSLRVAYEFASMGLPVVGVPKTIDNDLSGTDVTFGYDTALGVAVDAIDRLHTTAESHGRIMLVEVMGRYAGWIALGAGVAGGADVILLPEIPFEIEKAAAKVAERDGEGRKFTIVVVAEGCRPVGGELTYRDLGGVDRMARLGGVSEQVRAALEDLTGKESRVVVLGHLQRGGSPTPSDRLLASSFGAAAVRAIAHGHLGRMVSWRDNATETVPLEAVIAGVRKVPLEHPLIQTARDLGITFAGEAD